MKVTLLKLSGYINNIQMAGTVCQIFYFGPSFLFFDIKLYVKKQETC